MSNSVKFLIQHALCGASLFCAALVCCAVIFGVSPGSDWLVMLFTAPLSAGAIGIIGWAGLTSFGRRVKIWKGVAAGALAGALSHFAAWYLSIVFLYLQKSVTPSMGEPTVGPIEGLWASLVMTFFSLAVLGWATVPIGAAIGAMLAAFSRRFLSDRLA
jgi:hypothetical protein